MESSLTRRSFVKWSALAGGAAATAGLVACSPQEPGQDADAGPAGGEKQEGSGQWLTASCNHNCCCGASRCLVKVYVEDGVPLKIRTDEEDQDSLVNPQRRACSRGRAQISNVLSPARIKYPMKRKGWSPEEPNGQLRGIDEWERISWDEALDYVADGIKKTIDQYGPKGILCAGPTGFYDTTVHLLDALGGSVHTEAGTVSFGSWSVADTHMVGGFGSSGGPHHMQFSSADLHVFFGNNWIANKAGNHGWFIDQARESGSKMIFIEPWLNQMAQAVADEWIPVLPGSDTALVLAICYQWIKNNTYDQEYLDKYCIGFDADHMPEGAPKEENYKDYVLGTYDNEPKTPEWAEKICGVPAATIVDLADEIAAVDKVNFFASQSTSKIPAGEQFVQVFYTMALMHGGIGTPGHYMGWKGLMESNVGTVAAGDSIGADKMPANAFAPTGAPVYMAYPIPMFDVLEDPDSWENLEPSETWTSILNGETGRDIWPTGKHKIDMHAIYFGSWQCALNQLPNINAGIEAVRGMDFVWGSNPYFDPSRQYCDVVLPCISWWELSNLAYSAEASAVFWYDKVMEPIYDAKTENWIAEELATRLGIDPKVPSPYTDDERRYNSIKGAVVSHAATGEVETLLTISQEDIDALGVDGEPQEGIIALEDFKAKGIYKYPITESSTITEPFAAFYADPEANPLPTASGKFEIYSEMLASRVNAVGYSTISPIGKWQIGDPEQGVGTQTDEFPLLLWTPHSLRRAHSINDNVTALREAFPQECFLSTVDAEARGIQTGDTVLMSSPHGKVLRPAKVMPTIVPGAVAIQDGSWIRIDEETGIDLGGNPNVLQAPKSSGGGSQSWTGTLCQVEKYTGDLELVPDKECPIVMPVGIE